MKVSTSDRHPINPKARGMFIVLVIGVAVLVITGLIISRNPDWRRLISSRLRLGLAVLDSQRVRSYSRGQFTNIVFLHHSVGHNLIEQGNVRQRFTEAGFNFWDQGYNWEQLRDPEGNTTNYSYYVPDDNTDPDGLAAIFAQPVYRLPLNTLSGLLQHEVIAFKSCFPVSNISDEAQLERYKAYYLSMRQVMDKYPDKIFVILTPPPLNPAETNAEAAARARAFANWLQSDDYLKGRPNLFTFDLFGYLAENDPLSPERHMLRSAYRDGADSHPNPKANQTIGPLFVDFVIKAVESYRANVLTKDKGRTMNSFWSKYEQPS